MLIDILTSPKKRIEFKKGEDEKLLYPLKIDKIYCWFWLNKKIRIKE